ncbi:MAG: 1-deoxy-D-xylulose-5-phosphate synthase [Planctomycetota bacterium]
MTKPRPTTVHHPLGNHPLLATLDNALPLKGFSEEQLELVAAEIRDVLCNLLATRTAHFASNLCVVELCLALHCEFDFRSDRLIWDTGHQVYPHKLVTGRYGEFGSIRTRGGLMGYPNPAESVYDLFMTGHAGCSVSTAVGLRSGDLIGGKEDRHSVAVIGDGAFPSGIVFEALNNAGDLNQDLTIVLNDNKMSICPRTGSLAQYLDNLRSKTAYSNFKNELIKVLDKVPVIGDSTERLLGQIKEGVKAGMLGGMLFEDLGIRYIGPIDGHDIPLVRKYLRRAKEISGPVLLHVVTEKGHGYKPAADDPVYFHTPPAFKDRDGKAVAKPASSGNPPYTQYARDAIATAMDADQRVTVITAAMCQGNKLEPVREKFPDRFFDVGICEAHAVAFAAGQAKTGLRPIVDIYSTFLQRSYDQIFQEVTLQNLPVTFMLDRAGLTGPDGPTHHGVYDLGYMRLFPNMVCMAPGYAEELQPMLDFALQLEQPASIRYPKASVRRQETEPTPVSLGRSECIRKSEREGGPDGTIVAIGAILDQAMEAAELLSGELDIEVINARFIKPIDEDMVQRVCQTGRFVITLEEGTSVGGFGSAFLESAVSQRLDTRVITTLGLPDKFVEHGDRDDLLDTYGLSPDAIASTCREAAKSVAVMQ